MWGGNKVLGIRTGGYASDQGLVWSCGMGYRLKLSQDSFLGGHYLKKKKHRCFRAAV